LHKRNKFAISQQSLFSAALKDSEMKQIGDAKGGFKKTLLHKHNIAFAFLSVFELTVHINSAKKGGGRLHM